jgi:hypothetical protein
MKRIFKFALAVTAATALLACGGGGGGDGGSTSQVAATNTAIVVNQATGAVMTRTFEGDPLVFAAGINAGGLVIPGPATLVITSTSGTTQTFNITAAGGVVAGELTYGSCKFEVKTTYPGGPVVGTIYTIADCGIEAGTANQVVGSPTSTEMKLKLGNSTSNAKIKTVTIRTDGTVSITRANGDVIVVPGLTVTVKTVTGTN